MTRSGDGYIWLTVEKEEEKKMKDVYKKIALFIGGTLFGSIGIKLLTSRDAKNAYIHVTAAGLRAKDYVMKTATEVQENADDILASAKDLNEKREETEVCCCCETAEEEKAED